MQHQKRTAIRPHQERFQVRSFDVDTDNRLTPTALTRYLLEAAWQHAKLLGYGYSALGERQRFWVLSRIAVEIRDLPYWEDIVEVETWPGGSQRIFALREYEMRLRDGRVAALGTSAWLVLDSETRRPVRIESLFDPRDFDEFRRALDRPLEKLPILELAAPADSPQDDTKNTNNANDTAPPSGRRTALACPPDPDYRKTVVYSDLDRHDHVNSVAYLKWIIDSYPWQALESAHLDSFELNYLAETGGGEEVELFSTPHDTTGPDTIAPADATAPAGSMSAGDTIIPSGTRVHLVRRRSDHQPICSARLTWR